MPNNSHTSRRIRILRDDVARRIAAGEVIDRPFSVVRELLDNALDASAAEISVSIENGGMKKITVVDNGYGMSSEDLQLCFKPRATSKITEISDLDRLHTLGFRGEALASIAACSRLSITSMQTDSHTAWKILVTDGKLVSSHETHGLVGTRVDVEDLFFNIPARRKFLKRPSSETLACRNTALDKAIPHFETEFKFLIDDDVKFFLPRSDCVTRIVNCFPDQLRPELLYEFSSRKGGPFSVSVFIADLSLAVSDRRMMYIFLNGRRIQEYSLLQAVEYGLSDYLVVSRKPVAFVFIHTEPDLVDFNIHPAKREVRIRNIKDLHHSIVTLIKNGFSIKFHGYRPPVYEDKAGTRDSENELGLTLSPSATAYSDRFNENTWAGEIAARSGLHVNPVEKNITTPSFVYLGQAFGEFLVCEKEKSIYIVDQHAAHERIIYNRLSTQSFSPQKLLIPLPVETDDIGYLRKNSGLLLEAGITVEEDGDEIRILSMPEIFTNFTDIVLEVITSGILEPEIFRKQIISGIACRTAIKSGEIVDPYTAIELLKATFDLEIPHCPHGRPIWKEISQTELEKGVCRIL